MKKLNKVFLIAFFFCICIIAIPNKALADNQEVIEIDYYCKNNHGQWIKFNGKIFSGVDLEIRVKFNSKLKDNEKAKISFYLTDENETIHKMYAYYSDGYCGEFELKKFSSYDEKKYYVRINGISGDCLSYKPHVSIRKNSWEEGKWEEQNVDGYFPLTINDELTVKDCYVVKNDGSEDRTVLFR